MDVTLEFPEMPEEMIQAYQETEGVPLPLGIGASLLCLAMGLACLLRPDVVWEIQHLLDVQGGEPTDHYLISTRILGAAILILGVVCAVLTVLSWL